MQHNGEREAFLETAAAFGRRRLKPMLEARLPDGDPSDHAAALAEAREIGLLAGPSPECPGHECGVWGQGSIREGPGLSLELLSRLAEVDGGFAAAVHQAGLASRLISAAQGDRPLPAMAVPALFESGWPFGARILADPSAADPEPIATELRPVEGGWELVGRKGFVSAPAGLEALVVFARQGKEWALAVAPADAPGVTRREAGQRMGLSACPAVHFDFERVRLPLAARLDFGQPGAEVVAAHLARQWQGEVAIAEGIARGALAAARRYAADRYQGGTQIEQLPAVAELLSEAQGLCDALSPPRELSVAAAAERKAAALPLLCRAVSNCLQVLGGYGYMEDYGLEKRYRDAHTLKCAGGSPPALRLLAGALRREGRP